MPDLAESTNPEPSGPDPFDAAHGAALLTQLCPWWPWVPTVMSTNRLMVERYEASQRGSGFQRKRSERWVEATVREFQAALVNIPKVALVDDGRRDRGMRPDELLASVLDGGHTVAILDRRGYSEVPVLLYRGFPSYEERARLFYEHNERRRALRVAERFAGRYEADEETANGLLEAVHAHGFYVADYKPRDSNGELHRLEALSALFNSYRDHPAALDSALYVLEAWKEHGNGFRTVERTVIEALTQLARSDRFDAKRMRSVLDQHGPTYLTDLALRLDNRRTLRPTPRTMREALIKEYNTRLGRSRRLGEAEGDDA